MPLIEKSVPYSLAECIQKLEALHETPPSYAEVLSPSYVIKFYSNWGRRAYRTTVRRFESDSRSGLYRMERIQREARFFTFINFAQVQVGLEDETPQRTRITYQVRAWPIAKIIQAGVGLFGTSFMLLIALSSGVVWLLAVAGLFAVINLFVVSTTFKAQTEILMSQFEQVFLE